MTFDEIASYQVIEKTHLIIKNMVQNKQEWCIEMLLDVLHELLSQFNDVVKQHESEIINLVNEIFSNFDICVQLLQR